jgi:hypothetical protein
LRWPAGRFASAPRWHTSSSAGGAIPFLPPSRGDRIRGLGNGDRIDSAGAAYVTGGTDSTDFDTVGQIEGDSLLAPHT